MLKNLNASDERTKEWNIFLERIMHAAYAHSNNDETNELCRMSDQLLNYL